MNRTLRYIVLIVGGLALLFSLGCELNFGADGQTKWNTTIESGGTRIQSSGEINVHVEGSIKLEEYYLGANCKVFEFSYGGGSEWEVRLGCMDQSGEMSWHVEVWDSPEAWDPVPSINPGCTIVDKTPVEMDGAQKIRVETECPDADGSLSVHVEFWGSASATCHDHKPNPPKNGDGW